MKLPSHVDWLKRHQGIPVAWSWSILSLFIAWTLVPILWMVMGSLKTSGGDFSMPPRIFFIPDLSNYENLFAPGKPFLSYARNSIIASISATGIGLLAGSMAGFALAWGRIRREKDISFWIISTRMAPIAAVILPLYMIFLEAGVLNTLFGLVIAYVTFTLPFSTWMMKIFFESIPEEVIDAAKIDGCSAFRTFRKIALPLVRPGIVVTGILCFIFCWNDYLFAAVFTSADRQTIPVAVTLLITQRGIVWGQIMATGTFILLPALFVGFLVRRHLVTGLSMGAVKG